VAAEEGREPLLAGMSWFSDDAKLKHFSALYATERRLSYVEFNVLEVPGDSPPFRTARSATG